MTTNSVITFKEKLLIVTKVSKISEMKDAASVKKQHGREKDKTFRLLGFWKSIKTPGLEEISVVKHISCLCMFHINGVSISYKKTIFILFFQKYK